MVIFKFLGVLFSIGTCLFLYQLKEATAKQQKREAMSNFILACITSVLLIGLLTYATYSFNMVVSLNLSQLVRQVFAYLLVVNNGLVVLSGPYFILNISSLMSEFEHSKTRIERLAVYWMAIFGISSLLYTALLFI